MKTSPRPKARPVSKSAPMTKSKRPMPAEPARTQFMLKRQVRVGDGYAKGGMIKKATASRGKYNMGGMIATEAPQMAMAAPAGAKPGATMARSAQAVMGGGDTQAQRRAQAAMGQKQSVPTRGASVQRKPAGGFGITRQGGGAEERRNERAKAGRYAKGGMIKKKK